MQCDESGPSFLKRVFAALFEDLSPASSDRVGEFFSADFVMHADGQYLGRDSFLRAMVAQKSRLREKPRFSWTQLRASPPKDGIVHITSAHRVDLPLRDGSNAIMLVMALVQVDSATGLIVRCDELTSLQDEARTSRSHSTPGHSSHGDYLSSQGKLAAYPSRTDSAASSYDTCMTTFEAELAAAAVPDTQDSERATFEQRTYRRAARVESGAFEPGS